jgi:uncharacterized protein YcfJ
MTFDIKNIDPGTALQAAEFGAGFVPGKLLGPFAQGITSVASGAWTANQQQADLEDLARSIGISPIEFRKYSPVYKGAAVVLDRVYTELPTRFGFSTAGGAAGAATGAAIGSVVPGIGTAIGFVGGLAGGIAGAEVGNKACDAFFDGREHFEVISTALAVDDAIKSGKKVDEFTVFELAASTAQPIEREEIKAALSSVKPDKDGNIKSDDQKFLMERFSYIIRPQIRGLLGDDYHTGQGIPAITQLTAAVNSGRVAAAHLLVTKHHIPDLPPIPYLTDTPSQTMTWGGMSPQYVTGTLGADPNTMGESGQQTITSSGVIPQNLTVTGQPGQYQIPYQVSDSDQPSPFDGQLPPRPIGAKGPKGAGVA